VTEPESFACKGAELQRRRVAHALIVIGLGAMLVVAYLGARLPYEYVGWRHAWLPLGVMAALAIFFTLAVSYAYGFRRAGTVTLDDTGMILRTGTKSREERVARREVTSGYTIPRTGEVKLELTGARGLRLELQEGDAGERLLERLGQSVRSRALAAPLRGELGALTKGLVALLVSSVASLALFGSFFGPQHLLVTLFVSLAASTTFTAFVLRRFGWPKVYVGIDGVRVAGGLRARFVPYVDIGPVHEMSGELQVALRDGTLLHLQTVGQSHDEIAALARRIEQGRAACLTGATNDLGALGRDGRSIHQWNVDVRRTAIASGGFREQALGREDYERLLLDARAPTDQRIGAALALRAVDPDAPARIRVAATASANEKLRVALEACARADEGEEVDHAALEGALTP